MPLPHPHGTASGEIGHNALIDLGSTPGSVGGKFVGFGEEGISSIANRSSWALSENIDYVYDKLSTPFAMAEMAAWTPTGGAGTKYQFTGGSASEVWVGDPSYLPETQLKRDQLFSLLDSNFNQLVDASSNKVVVRLVQDATETTNVFGTGDGFETNPVIKFQTVNPMTGVVVNPSYTIPDGTAMYVVHGRYQTLENLPPDAFTKIPIRVGEEVPAGVVMQDGSRPMTGNLNLNNFSLQNVSALNGPIWPLDMYITANALSTLTINGGTELDLIASGDIDFSAQGIAGTLVNAGDLDIQGSNNSVVGSLNNSNTLGNAVHGNRFYEVSGSITFGAAGLVSYPQLKVILNGDARTIASGSVTAPATTHTILVVNSAGTVVQRTLANVVYSDIPIAHYYWVSGSTYAPGNDLRRVLFQGSSALDVTVGTDYGSVKLPGCDFSDLDDAINYVRAVSQTLQGNGSLPPRCTVRVLGYTNVTNTIILPDNLTLVGEGPTAIVSAWHSDTASTLNAYNAASLSTASNITIKNITFRWSMLSTQTSTEGAIANLGSNSRVLDCRFVKNGSFSFANAIVWNSVTNRRNISIQRCYADVLNRFIYARSTTSESRVLDLLVTDNDIWNTNTIAASFAIEADGYRSCIERNYIHDSYFSTAHHGFGSGGIVLGANSVARGNTVEGTESGSGILFDPKPVSSNDKVYCLINGNTIGAFDNSTPTKGKLDLAVNCQIDAGHATEKFHIVIENNVINGVRAGVSIDNDPGEIADSSDAVISGNAISGISGLFAFAIFVKFAKHAHIHHNTISACSGIGIGVFNDTLAYCESNEILGFHSTAPLLSAGIYITPDADSRSKIVNNHIVATGSDLTAGSACIFFEGAVDNDGGGQIAGNTIDPTTGSGQLSYGIYSENAYKQSIVNNIIETTSSSAIYVVSSSTNPPVGALIISGNVLRSSDEDTLSINHAADIDAGRVVITGNVFSTVPSGHSIVFIKAAADVEIVNNVFGHRDATTAGRAIHLENDGSTVTSRALIKGNAFESINGVGNTPTTAPTNNYASVILVHRAECRNVEISENVFQSCGVNDTSGLLYSAIIRAMGDACSIIGNIIQNIVGPQNTSGVSYAIHSSTNAVVLGNSIIQDVSLSTFTLGTFAGIFIDGEYANIATNIINLTGTTIGTAQKIYGILNNDKSNLVVANNNVSFWTNAGGPPKYNWAIFIGSSALGDTANLCTVIGNRSGDATNAYNITCACPGTDPYNSVVGNVVGKNGLVEAGSNVSAGNAAMP